MFYNSSYEEEVNIGMENLWMSLFLSCIDMHVHLVSQGFFPVSLEHDKYPWDWEFHIHTILKDTRHNKIDSMLEW